MRLQDPIGYLQENHLGEWLKMRSVVQEEVSAQQSMFCVCGRLATGFHEGGCRKFAKKVNSETAKRLKHLLPKEVASTI